MKYRPTAAARLLPAAPLLLALWAASANAQTLAPGAQVLDEATATAPALVIDDTDRALLLAFGNRAGLARLADQVVDRLAAEGRLQPAWRDAAPADLKQGLAEHLCQALRGPCAPQRDAGIGRSDFKALAPLLQDSMNAQAVPPAARDALLARLAPGQQRVVMR